MDLRRLFLGVALALGLLVTGWVQAAQVAQLAQPYTELKQARMKGLGPEKTVSLPHMLAPADFAPEGSLVSYTLLLDLAVLPEKPLGVYVPKTALSGNIYVNGELFGACERGPLKEVRCLHRPLLVHHTHLVLEAWAKRAPARDLRQCASSQRFIFSQGGGYQCAGEQVLPVALLAASGPGDRTDLVIGFAGRDGFGRGCRVAQGFGVSVVWPDKHGQCRGEHQRLHEPTTYRFGAVQLDCVCQPVCIGALVDLDVRLLF
jgi:hypothetical protein